MEKICLPYEIKKCIEILNANHYECFVVGGAIRDSLLNRTIHDYDLSTSAKPDEVCAVFKDYLVIQTGLKHGTVTVYINHMPIEITTYRIESDYLDHRHPAYIAFTKNIQEDCARRDLTINALSYHPTGGIFDFYDGIKDLHSKTIRLVGNPSKRLEEDALRILRVLRFSAELNFTIEKNTSEALHLHKSDLKFISLERITEEFSKILSSKKPGKTLFEYKDVFSVLFPSFDTLTEKNSLRIDESSCNFITRLIILFSEFDENDIFTLKLPNKTVHSIKKILSNLSLPCTSLFEIRYVLYKLDSDSTCFFEVKEVLDSSFSKKNVKETVDAIYKNQDCISIKQLAITGKDILEECSITGSEIKKTLEKCLIAVMKEEIRNTKESLLSFVKNLN